MKVLSASQMREIDSYAINKLLIPGVVLMENAGIGVRDAVFAALNKLGKNSRVAVVCGKGNNGGDGFVVSRHLFRNNVDVITYLLASPKDLKGDALTNFRALKNYGAQIEYVRNAREFGKKINAEKKPKIIVDAILGTGLKSNVKGFYADVINFINKHNSFVVAVDVPSGLDSDSGFKLGQAVVADTTVTFGFAKLGHLLGDSFKYVGDLIIKDISLPKLDNSDNYRINLVDPSYVRSLFKPRAKNAHKGSHGHVGIIAGSKEKSGAARLASLSALRAGSGLVTCAVPESAHDVIKSPLFNVMTYQLPDSKGYLKKEAVKKALDFAKGMNVIAIGPGVMKNQIMCDLILRLINDTDKPLIVDADGLNSIAGKLKKMKGRENVVFTPHPGEMERLTGVKTKDIQNDRLKAVRNFIKKYGVTVVLKGYRSLIGFPDGSICINSTGNPGMSTAGMGDVLTGLMASYVGQQKDFKKAVVSAVFNHGLLGDLIVAEKGERGILASDLVNKLTDINKTLYPGKKLNKIEEV